jgi:hypothetical protein
MKKLIRIPVVCLSLMIWFPAFADFTFLVNNATGIHSVKKSDIKSIFLGRKKLWSNGLIISPCYGSANSKNTQLFFSRVIKKGNATFIRYWNKKLFAGSGQPPVIVESAKVVC